MHFLTWSSIQIVLLVTWDHAPAAHAGHQLLMHDHVTEKLAHAPPPPSPLPPVQIAHAWYNLSMHGIKSS